MRVASASEDGTIRVWDVSDGACLRTIDMGQRILHMCSTGPGKLICLGKRRIDLVSLSKVQNSKIRLFSGAIPHGEDGRVHSSGDGRIVAMVSGKLLRITSATSEGSTATIKHRHLLTALCVSHDGSMLAVGDETGIITVYPNPAAMLPDTTKMVKLERSCVASSILHWHPSPVRGLEFTKDSTFLYSGGTEAALLAWKMTRNHFGQRKILPRLRAPILAISLSTDESLCALTQADNSVRIINLVSSDVANTIQGISATIAGFNELGTSCFASKVSPSAGAAVRVTRIPQREGQVIVSGNGGSLQLFDVYKGLHLFDINVVPRNIIHGPTRSLGLKPDPVTVKAAEMHSSGKLMVTVEVQNLASARFEDCDSEKLVTTLRFWDISPDNDATLTAVCTRPHGVDKDVSSICFHPHLFIAVTTSTNGSFKIWRAMMTQSNRKAASWRTEVELGYKGLPCNSSCFSNDGSLLAVACGSVLTLWHIEDLIAPAHDNPSEGNPVQLSGPTLSATASLRAELLHALVHPPAEEHLQSVRFVYKQAPLFVAATAAGIYVWNALTQGIWWSSRIRTRPETLTVNEFSGHLGIAVQIPATTFGSVDDRHMELKKRGVVTNDANIEDIDAERKTLASSGKVQTAKGSKEAPGILKGNKKHPKRMRSRTNDNNFSRETAQCEAEGRSVCETDCAIALFDVASPYPLRVMRLSAGVDVVSLQFVSHPDLSKEGRPSLVCIDSNIGVSFLGAHGDEDRMSMVTMSSHSSLADGGTAVSKLYTLLGTSPMAMSKEVHTQAGETMSQPLHKSDIPNMRLKNLELISEFFEGPTHVQAPVSTKSADFIRALRTRGAVTKTNSPDEVPAIDDHSTTERTTDVERAFPDALLKDNYETCYDICAEILRSHLPRKKVSKTLKSAENSSRTDIAKQDSQHESEE